MNLILTIEKFEIALAKIAKGEASKGHIAPYAALIDKLQGMVKTQLVSMHLEMAQKSCANEKDIVEKDLLICAYRKIKASNITDEDLRTANLKDYTTGTNLTLSGIEQRLMQLGWEG